jgi:hypothetical protein
MISHSEFNKLIRPIISGLVGEKSADEIIVAISPSVKKMAYSIIENSVYLTIKEVKNEFR